MCYSYLEVTMIKNKIVSLLSLNGYRSSDYARYLNIAPQSLHTKYVNDAFKLSDLLKLAEMNHCKLSFTDENDNIVISFDLSDLKQNSQNK